MSILVCGGLGSGSSGQSSAADIYELEEKIKKLETTISGMDDVVSELNNTVDSMESTISSLNSTIETLEKQHLTLDKAYPIGSIYISYNSTDPSTLFGGSWTQLQNRFLIGAGSSYTVGETGGEETVTLSQEEIPSHSHSTALTSGDRLLATSGNVARKTVASGSGVSNVITSTEAFSYAGTSTGRAGDGKAHNNMPPYLAVYIWRRTS